MAGNLSNTTVAALVGLSLVVGIALARRRAAPAPVRTSADDSPSSTSSSLASSSSTAPQKSTIESSTSSENDDDSDDDKDKAKHARDIARGYEERRENYDPLTGQWVTQAEVEEVVSADILFTVKHRTWPKSQDYSNERDYISVAMKSEVLVECVRKVVKEVEEAYEREPSLDANHLYLHVEELRAILKEKELALAAKNDGPSSPAPDAADAEAEEDKGSDAPKDQVELPTEAYVAHLKILVEFIDKLFAPTKEKLARLQASAQISFSLLWALFPVGAIVESTDPDCDEKFCFELNSGSYQMTRDGLVFSLTGTRILHNGTRFTRSSITTRITSFKSLRRLSSLPAKPASEGLVKMLRERGRRYVELTEKVRFVEYKGSLLQVFGCGMERKVIKMRAEGRAVVDTKSYRRMNPTRAQNNDWDGEEDDDYFDYEYANQHNHHGGGRGHGHLATVLGAGESVSEELWHLLPPTVFGFSLVQREWREMMVTQFEDVAFNEKAWDQLVLENDQKDLIRGLVEQNSLHSKGRAEVRSSSSASVVKEQDTEPEKEVEKAEEGGKPPKMVDFIAGKGGGLVIALHGRPGVGKTLTAEAVAEHLKVPLYSIGAGELGVTADVLEKRLRDTLDVASTWGAVMLIDEADVFLEQRSLHDVARNAMVSCFLRLLEYHSGILVLTTNRIRTIDPARFSIALTYPDLDAAKRKQIWQTFIECAGFKIVDANPDSDTTGISNKYLTKLAQKPFNGRSIKNIVRTAQALAASKGEGMKEEHVGTVMRLSERFMEDFKEADEEGIYDVKGEGWKDRQNFFS
ncbi:AAA family ATPase [Pseudohyphozyma bogoriensis]|nr:AAA family ATPase [Pseudohyphozyma bogoriensis]